MKDQQQIIIDSLMARIREVERENDILKRSLTLSSDFPHFLVEQGKIEPCEFVDFVDNRIAIDSYLDDYDYKENVSDLSRKLVYQSLSSDHYKDLDSDTAEHIDKYRSN